MSATIASVAALGSIARLEPAIERAFGRGDRRPGWFLRKVHREWVDEALSTVAIVDGIPVSWVLVGRPPSRAPLLRTAGIGTLLELRGRGLCSRVLAHVAEHAREHGYEGIETLTEPGQLGFYQARGFAPVMTTTTMLCFGHAEATNLHTSAREAPQATALAEWLADAWERTPTEERMFVEMPTELGAIHLRISREGAALLVQRVATSGSVDAPTLAAMLERMRHRVGKRTPLLVFGCDRSLRASLHDYGWIDGQEVVLVKRSL